MASKTAEQKMLLELTVFDDEAAEPEATAFRSRCDAFMAEVRDAASRHGLYFGGTTSIRDVED